MAKTSYGSLSWFTIGGFFISFFLIKGLIDQLSTEYGDNYHQDVTEFAVEQLEANGVATWDAECEESAQSYLDMMPMSKQELID